MIQFHSPTKVTVTTLTHPERTFTVKDWPVGVSQIQYMDYIMNKYWYLVGKNRRLYE